MRNLLSQFKEQEKSTASRRHVENSWKPTSSISNHKQNFFNKTLPNLSKVGQKVRCTLLGLWHTPTHKENLSQAPKTSILATKLDGTWSHVLQCVMQETASHTHHQIANFSAHLDNVILLIWLLQIMVVIEDCCRITLAIRVRASSVMNSQEMISRMMYSSINLFHLQSQLCN